MKSKPFVIHEKDCDFDSWDDPERGNSRWRTLISSDRCPSDSMSAGICELDPGEGSELALHSHNHGEIYYFLAGEGTVRVGGEEYPVCPGTTVFTPADVEHGVRNTGDDLLRFFYVFAVDCYDKVKYTFSG